jgi:phage gp29-like protein
MPLDLITRARRAGRTILSTAAALADAAGRPFKEADLRKGGEHAKPAGRGARPWTYAAIAGGLTPSKLAAMFVAADSGDNVELLTLASDIERRDSHAGAQLRTRKLALASLPWKVEAVSDDTREVALAEELQALVERPEFTFLVIDLMDAVSKGYSVAEITWERGARWSPRAFIWRDQRHFTLDPENGTTLRLRTEAQPKDGEEMPAFCFVAHVPRLASGPLATSGLVRPLAVMYSVKTLGLAAWLA